MPTMSPAFDESFRAELRASLGTAWAADLSMEVLFGLVDALGEFECRSSLRGEDPWARLSHAIATVSRGEQGQLRADAGFSEAFRAAWVEVHAGRNRWGTTTKYTEWAAGITRTELILLLTATRACPEPVVEPRHLRLGGGLARRSVAQQAICEIVERQSLTAREFGDRIRTAASSHREA